MKHLYAPWRRQYVTKKEKCTKDDRPAECVFCQKLAENNDEENLILGRYEHCAVFMNLYPYSTGHLMVIPIEHRMYPHQLPEAARTELMERTSRTIEILEHTLKTDGLNVGINLGRAAGAGIPAHLHVHVLPRWTGDTNFMPLIAEVKPISINLKEMYQELRPYFISDANLS